MINIVLAILAISGVIMTGLGLYSRQFRDVPARLPFACMVYLDAGWCFLALLGGVVDDLSAKLTVFQMMMAVVAVIPVTCLVTTLHLLGMHNLLSRGRIAGLLAFPIGSIILNATNGLTSLFITGYRAQESLGLSTLALDYGPAFFIYLAYSYLLLLATLALLLWHFSSTSGLYRWRDLMVIIAFSLPMGGTTAMVLGISGGVGLTPMLFVVTGLALALALFRFRMLDIMPVAKGLIMDLSSDLIIVLDHHGKVVDINAKAAKLMGLSKRAIGKDVRELALEQRGLQDLLEGKAEDGRTIALEMTTGRRYYDCQVDRIVDGSTFMGQVMVLRDITESRRAQEALRESEERYRAIFDQFEGTIMVVDIEDGSLLQANQAFCTHFGIDPDEVTALNVQSIAQLDHTFKDNILGEVMSGRRFTFETTFPLPNGNVMNIEVVASPFRYGGKRAICIMGRDITERRQAEAIRERIEKLEATGTLAGGIAHDFNNLLTSVLGYVSLTKMHSQPGSETHRELEEAEMTILQAKEVAQELLSLAKGGAPICKPVSIPDLLKVTSNHPFLNSNVQCHLHIPPGKWIANIDQGQIGRVFTNLFLNAKDAMPKGGRVDVTVSKYEAGEQPSRTLRPGDYILVEVRDTGSGISPEVLPKIFEPYFTTKSHGFGLGLSVVYATLARHQGGIEVDSKLGEGTAFRVYLPAAEVTASPDAEQGRSIERGEGWVLVMDDEEYILDVTTEMIKALGYDVGAAHDGQEALEEYRRALESGRGYDLVIMDLTNPRGMGGKEAIGLLLELDPRARAIVSSGYSNDPVMAEYRRHGFIGVLPKPYKLEELSYAIKQGLVGSRANAGQSCARSTDGKDAVLSGGDAGHIAP